MKPLLVAFAIANIAFIGRTAILGAQTAADVELDERVAALSRQLRCLVCQNETLADSQADLAVDLRRELRDQLKAGRNEAEIISFLTERYGDFVLYRPPLKASTYPLWYGPFVLLAAGLVSLGRILLCRPISQNGGRDRPHRAQYTQVSNSARRSRPEERSKVR